MKTLSTTALSKELGLTSKELFDKLVDLKLIYRKDDKWHLTEKGKTEGGQLVSNEKYGEFIVWPENFNPLEVNTNSGHKELLNATKIAEQFQISNRRVNNIFAEIGWIEQSVKGWTVTSLGKKVGGVQREHQSGGTFVLWPTTILDNLVFLKSIKPTEYIVTETTTTERPNQKTENKYPDTLLKTKDGHLVRSRAELIIDNLLYDYGLTHAYERELTVAETVLSDFYIPARNGKENKGKAVYIEFWGISDNDKYLERKKIKQEIYKKNNLNLIELDDSHLDNLDSILRKMLLKFEISVE